MPTSFARVLTGIYRCELGDGKRDRWLPSARLGAIGLCRGALVVAAKDGISLLDTATGTFRPLVDREANGPNSRINDAKVERAGRFWVGYQEDSGKTATGKLYSIDGKGAVKVVDDGYIRMYVSDTRIRTIWVYDFDLASGSASNKRVFAKIPSDEGSPDGTIVDSQDYVWSARNGGGCAVRYAPDGSIDRKVPLPASHVSNMTFGGDDPPSRAFFRFSRPISVTFRS